MQADPGQVPDENEILNMVMDTLQVPENAHSQIDSLIEATSQNNFPILDSIKSLFKNAGK